MYYARFILGASPQYNRRTMAPVIIPPDSVESFTLSGTGTLLLTQPQLSSRTLSISIEKVKLPGPNEYYNFRTPEPEAFWGYVQLVERDFIIKQIQLEYRRQLLYQWDKYELEPIEQLRCLVKESTLLLFDNMTAFLIASGYDPIAIGQDRANYLLSVGQPRLIPSVPMTAVWYEIAPNFLGQLTITWADYAAPCANPAGIQRLPSPRGNANTNPDNNPGGGGGTRPATPPPPNRSADPDSDSPAPPPDSPTGPSSPSPAPPNPPNGTYVVVYQNVTCQFIPATGANGMVFGSLQSITLQGPATLSQTPSGTASTWNIVDSNGLIVSSPLTAPTSNPSSCGGQNRVEIISQTLIP